MLLSKSFEHYTCINILYHGNELHQGIKLFNLKRKKFMSVICGGYEISLYCISFGISLSFYPIAYLLISFIKYFQLIFS